MDAPVPVPADIVSPPKGPDPFDYSDKYNTKLSPKEEQKFQAWAEKNNRAGDSYDYDIRGAWKELQSGTMKEADNGHLGDKYKKPNHPTFSDQSIHSGKEGIKGGTWGKDKEGKDTFTPSPNHMWGKDELQRYFSDREQGVVLIDNR
jgi:hypothetical protein